MEDVTKDRVKPDRNQKLAVSTLVAQMVYAGEVIDLEVLDYMINEQSAYDVIEPMLDPTRWRREHKGMEATWAVLRAARDFIRVVDENKKK